MAARLSALRAGRPLPLLPVAPTTSHYIYIISNTTNKQLTQHHIFSIEFINYVKSMQNISDHLEPSSGDILFKAINTKL
jgi:hypothetical protein